MGGIKNKRKKKKTTEIGKNLLNIVRKYTLKPLIFNSLEHFNVESRHNLNKQ